MIRIHRSIYSSLAIAPNIRQPRPPLNEPDTQHLCNSYSTPIARKHAHHSIRMLRQLFSAVKFTITSPITAITATATTTTAATRTMSTAPPASPLKKPCKLALLQLASGNDKSANLANARKQVAAAAARGANIVVLPECFNSPYGTSYFRQYAEPIPHGDTTYPESLTPSYTALSAAARENNIYLIGGSIPEHDPSTDALYNTSLAFAPTGALLAAHRKIHLFDIDIPGKIRFIESEVLSPGAHPTLIDTPYGRVGVAICYDVRFPELAMLAARQGAFAMLYPGAFNMTTGPLHWELLARARAVDNQVWVGMCSPARSAEAGYTAWGHSMVVDPNGEVVAGMEEGEGYVEWELVPERVVEVRRGIPVTSQRRFDVYADVAVAAPTEGKDGKEGV